MEWFKRHLNWTWVFCWLLMVALSYTYRLVTGLVDQASIGGAIACLVCFLLWISSIIFWLVISGWVIKQKGESLWWLLLAGWWSPVWLRNIKTIVKEQMASLQDKP